MPQIEGESSSPKGLLKSLFDFKFASFVTSKIIRILYVIITILYSVLALVSFFVLISRGGIWIVLAIVVVPIAYLLYLTFARIWLELIIVIFRIAEDIHAIRVAPTSGFQRLGATAAPAPEAPLELRQDAARAPAPQQQQQNTELGGPPVENVRAIREAPAPAAPPVAPPAPASPPVAAATAPVPGAPVDLRQDSARTPPPRRQQQNTEAGGPERQSAPQYVGTGWNLDPYGVHELRYFSQGRPTKLVKDGDTESYDEPLLD